MKCKHLSGGMENWIDRGWTSNINNELYLKNLGQLITISQKR